MSNEPTVPVELNEPRLLTNAELDAVSGGGGSFPTENACEQLGALQKSGLPEQAVAKGIDIAVNNVCPVG